MLKKEVNTIYNFKDNIKISFIILTCHTDRYNVRTIKINKENVHASQD